MRTLTSQLLTELGLTVTRPGYLIEIAFSTPVRLSTLGNVSYGGNPWDEADVQVRGLSADGRIAQSGSLVFNNTWNDFGTAVLDAGVADRAIRIYACYAGAPADSVQIFDGVGDEVSFDDNGRMTIKLETSSINTSFWPRRRINASSGFTKLLPSGKTFTVGGQSYKLERR